MFRHILAAAAAILLVAAGAQGEGCKLKRLAGLDLTRLASGRFSTTVQVNGQPFHLMVDTGSDHTMLTERVATALGLKLEPFPNSVMYLWGGMQLKYLAKTESVQVGRLLLGASTFYVIPDDRMEPGSDGLIGTDILARFDADFDFAQGKLNLSLKDTGGAVLAISQFTLYGDCRKGRRPSYDDAAPGHQARHLYEHFVAALRREDVDVATGVFQATMRVSLVNEGPVTLICDSVTMLPSK